MAPVCAAVGILAWRGHPAAPVLALAPAFFAMSTYSQLILGNEYPALMVGIGLLRRQPWALKPAYAILGGYVLLGWSVAGMGWSMLASGDPEASMAVVVAVTGLASAGAVFAYFLYRPPFGASAMTDPGGKYGEKC